MSAPSSEHVDIAEVSNIEFKFEEAATAELSRLTPGRVNRMNKLFVVNKKISDITVDTAPIGKKREADGITKSPVQRTAKRMKANLNLPYNSIKSIKMPPRIGYVAGQVLLAPIDGTYPYGNTEDHHNSMLIHWLDEQELTYGAVTNLFNKAFPNLKITEEAVRRRHIRSLERLTKRYGAKALEEIRPVGKNILRRGKPRAQRLSDILPELDCNAPVTSDQSGDASVARNSLFPSIATTISMLPPIKAPTVIIEAPVTVANRSTASYSTLQAKKRKSQKTHEFKKACIVVWKDSLKMDFKAIRNKLEDQYSWSIGLATVEKYYYQAFSRVYGVSEAADGGEGGEGIASETGESNAEDDKDSGELADRSYDGKGSASPVENGAAEVDEALQMATADDDIPAFNV